MEEIILAELFLTQTWLLCNRPESAAILESENWTDQHCSDALLCWGFFAMSLTTICTMHWPLVPYCFIFKQNTTALPFPAASAWLPLYPLSTEVTWLWSLTVMQHAGTELWLLPSSARAAEHSPASHSCLCYLLRVVRERKCPAGHIRPICCVPYR